MLTPEQRTTVLSQAWYNAMVSEIDATLGAMAQRNIKFDGHLFLTIATVSVRVGMDQNDITIDVGLTASDDPGSAAYSFTVPAIWITG